MYTSMILTVSFAALSVATVEVVGLVLIAVVSVELTAIWILNILETTIFSFVLLYRINTSANF